jgi:hypothetical protein
LCTLSTGNWAFVYPKVFCFHLKWSLTAFRMLIV